MTKTGSQKQQQAKKKRTAAKKRKQQGEAQLERVQVFCRMCKQSCGHHNLIKYYPLLDPADDPLNPERLYKGDAVVRAIRDHDVQEECNHMKTWNVAPTHSYTRMENPSGTALFFDALNRAARQKCHNPGEVYNVGTLRKKMEERFVVAELYVDNSAGWGRWYVNYRAALVAKLGEDEARKKIAETRTMLKKKAKTHLGDLRTLLQSLLQRHANIIRWYGHQEMVDFLQNAFLVPEYIEKMMETRSLLRPSSLEPQTVAIAIADAEQDEHAAADSILLRNIHTNNERRAAKNPKQCTGT